MCRCVRVWFWGSTLPPTDRPIDPPYISIDSTIHQLTDVAGRVVRVLRVGPHLRLDGLHLQDGQAAPGKLTYRDRSTCKHVSVLNVCMNCVVTIQSPPPSTSTRKPPQHNNPTTPTPTTAGDRRLALLRGDGRLHRRGRLPLQRACPLALFWFASKMKRLGVGICRFA